jgi:hypothetical protein
MYIIRLRIYSTAGNDCIRGISMAGSRNGQSICKIFVYSRGCCLGGLILCVSDIEILTLLVGCFWVLGL